jgi:hypothetical protein
MTSDDLPWSRSVLRYRSRSHSEQTSIHQRLARLSTDVVAHGSGDERREIEDELQRVEEYHKKPSLLYRFLLETVIRTTFVGSVAAVIAGLLCVR